MTSFMPPLYDYHQKKKDSVQIGKNEKYCQKMFTLELCIMLFCVCMCVSVCVSVHVLLNYI